MLRWLVTALMAVVLLMGAVSVQAAEILQVRSGTVLQVGDHNRTYTVELACLAIPPDGDAAAAAWLRNAAPTPLNWLAWPSRLMEMRLRRHGCAMPCHGAPR